MAPVSQGTGGLGPQLYFADKEMGGPERLGFVQGRKCREETSPSPPSNTRSLRRAVACNTLNQDHNVVIKIFTCMKNFYYLKLMYYRWNQ